MSARMNEIRADKVMRQAVMQVEIKIVETPSFRVRKWIAKQLIRLASVALGCGVEFVDEEGATE